MNILAIDSATSILSVAVNNGENVFYKEDNTGARQSESAMLLIDEIMREADLKPSDLNGVVCMGGPGSFTGLRIGYSIAKGLALSLNIPFVAVPTLEKIKKDGGQYYYRDKRGLAKELLAVGRTMKFDQSVLYAGPKY